MSISRIDISAYLDGEMSPTEQDRLRREIEADAEISAEVRRLAAVDAVLRRDRSSVLKREVRDAQDLVRARLQTSTRGLTIHRPWWETEIRLPVPIAVAATAAFLLMTVMFVLQSNRVVPTNAGALAAGEGTVNVQVNVDGDDTDALLAWLNRQETFNNVTIQLPEQAEFQLRSAPVLMRRDETGERLMPVAPMHSSDEENDWEIVPLEEGER